MVCVCANKRKTEKTANELKQSNHRNLILHMNANAAIHTLSVFSALNILFLSLFSILPLGLLLPCVLLFDIRYFYASIALACSAYRLFVCSFFGLYFAHHTAVRSW